ncbi:hypothetical protein BDQ17DRAFT_1321699 [Cyathus striatus]|nr:hypothetical protein BDQ17DRAFT_1321699 [Cyathus striatus]
MSEQPHDHNHLEAALFITSIVQLGCCLALRCTLAQTIIPNAREHQTLLFSMGYSRRWFAKFMQAAGYYNFVGSIMRVIQTEYDQSRPHPAVKDPVISLILVGMHLIAIFICFGNAAILDSLPPQEEDRDIVHHQWLLRDPVYVSGAGLPVAYSRSSHINSTVSGPDDNVETVQATLPVSGEES